MQNKLFIFIVFIFSMATYAEEFTVQKTWFGDPDLQGVWTNASLTTLERPDHFETLEICDEVAAYAKNANQETVENIEAQLSLIQKMVSCQDDLPDGPLKDHQFIECSQAQTILKREVLERDASLGSALAEVLLC